MNDPYAEIRLAIATYDYDHARDLLRKALREKPSAEVYYLASQVALSDAQKKDFLKKAVELDPFHKEATYLLSRLESGAPVWSPLPEAYTAKIVQQGSQSYPLAGVGARLLAYSLDSVVLIIIGFATTLVYGAFVPIPERLDFPSLAAWSSAVDAWQLIPLLINLGISILYYAYFLTAQAGQTPGKAALNIRIIKLNGKPLTFWDAIVRNQIGYFLSTIIMLIGFLWILGDKRRQGWHDKLAGTVVIKAR